jgi:hypothetical protein
VGICLRAISFGANMGAFLLVMLCLIAAFAFLEDFFRDR